jgi:type II secretory pathway pseudopilin PulG
MSNQRVGWVEGYRRASAGAEPHQIPRDPMVGLGDQRRHAAHGALVRLDPPYITGGERNEFRSTARRSSGYTLVEMLTATTLSLIMLLAVVQLFSQIGQSVTDSRAMLDTADRLRAAQTRLQRDLEGVTAKLSPPRSPETNEGYFEYVEGLHNLGTSGQPLAVNIDMGSPSTGYAPDSTAGQLGDILMFTSHSHGEPFVGRCSLVVGGVIESQDAEIIWFLRGHSLHRRVLLICPWLNPILATLPTAPPNFYAFNDLSVHAEGDFDSSNNFSTHRLVANSLADLTRRENRFGHQTGAYGNGVSPPPGVVHPGVFPYDVRYWGQMVMPTLAECSSPNWPAGEIPKAGYPPWLVQPTQYIDLWKKPYPWTAVEQTSGNLSIYVIDPSTASFYPNVRVAEDVILDHCLNFDVKAWDPTAPIGNSGSLVLLPSDPGYTSLPTNPIGYGAFVDLGYAANSSNPNVSSFSSAGDVRSGLIGTYDTWCSEYASWSWFPANGTYAYSGQGLSTNGFDDNSSASNNMGVVDSPVEGNPNPPYTVLAPPYPWPLRAIQVKIRAFEADSRQVREVSLEHTFSPK